MDNGALLHFAFPDWCVVAAYVGLLLYLGFRGSQARHKSAGEFLLGGRMLTLPGLVAGLVSTWYGGVLGIGEFTWEHGLSNWLVFGAPYYVFALLFAWMFVGKIRAKGVTSIPDALYDAYDRRTGLLGSVLVFFISSPAPYFLMQAVLIQVVTGWPIGPALVVSTLISVVFVYTGGFRSLVRTDLLQFVLMFSGFFIMLGFLVATYGGSGFLQSRIPAELLHPTGNLPVQVIVVWFFIALWTLVAPPFHQFALAAKDTRTARRGIGYSVVCWIVFDAVTTATGLYARALMPDLAEPGMAFPRLGEMALPTIAKGVFFVGMVSTVMSTADGFAFIASMTLGRDIIGRARGRLDDAAVNRSTRIAIVITAVSGCIAALMFPSVINLWYVIGTIFIPGLLLPFIATVFTRLAISPRMTFVSMALGVSISALAFLWGEMHAVNGLAAYPFNIEPMYPGLAASAAMYVWKGLRVNGK